MPTLLTNGLYGPAAGSWRRGAWKGFGEVEHAKDFLDTIARRCLSDVLDMKFFISAPVVPTLQDLVVPTRMPRVADISSRDGGVKFPLVA